MQPYPNYLAPQYQNLYQNQYQNPYSQYQQNMQAIQQNQIPTQIVDSFDTIQANAVPMDMNGAFFIKRDGTEIQSRRWTQNGQIVTTSYFPKIGNEVNSSTDEIKSQNEAFNEFTQVFNDRINKVFDRLDMIEDLVTPRKRAAGKKEVVDNE